MKRDTAATIDELRAWLDQLCDLDRMNFQVLVSLPNALEVISKLSEGQYKRMAIAGLALRKALDELWT